MSFNFKVKNTNISCAPMYNSQNPDEVYGYLCNPQQRNFEGFEDASNQIKVNIGTIGTGGGIINTSPGKVVTLYEHCDKAGWVTPLPGVGVFTAGVHFAPNASYIDVPAGFTATIYTGNQTGRSKVINQNQAFVFCSEGGWANDSIRSIVVTTVGPPIPTSVTVYEHCDKAGWAKSLIGTRVFKAGDDFPPNASYIFVPPGFRATIYTGDQTGRSKVINENEAFVFCSENGWANDNIRSIVVTSSKEPVPVPVTLPVPVPVTVPVPVKKVRIPTNPFNPSSMGSLLIWLDSADQSSVALSGGNVSSWKDKSGNSNHFSVAPTYIPPSYKNINSGITFTSKQVMISTAPVTTNKNTTVFFVGNVASRNSDFDYILSFAEKDHAFRWNPRNRFGDSNDQDFAPDTGYIVNGQPTSVKYDFTQMALVNFVVANGGSGQLTLSTNKTFGGDRFFKGTIYELLIFNSPLTSAQTQQIQMYLMSKWNLPGFASGYSCPPGMTQTPEDLQNGTCLAPCQSTRGGSNTYNYGPKYGGYPLNRRSGADRCADLGNGTDQSQAFAARTSNWPPVTNGDPSCFVNGKFESAGMKLYTQNDCENVIGGNYYPTDHTPGYGECLYPEGGSHSYTCRRGQ